MSKCNNQNEIKKTHLVYDNITVQLSKKNTRFQYKLVKKGGRASAFENATEWLFLSGIVTRIYQVDIDAFKIYVSGIGLLCAKKEIVADRFISLAENVDSFITPDSVYGTKT